MKRRISPLFLAGLMLLLAACDNQDAPKPAVNKPGGVNDVLQQGMSQEDNKTKPNMETREEISAPETTSDTEEPQTSEVSVDNNLTEKDLAASTSENDPAASNPDSGKVDVDLTILSSTMVYSEVYNMVYNPDDYRGKTVKMEGQYLTLHDEATDNYYFCCLIQDATACCSQGIEFILNDDYRFPEDYPVPNSNICVVGVFDTYQEGEYTYCTLRNAKLI